MIDKEGNLWLHQENMRFNKHLHIKTEWKHIVFHREITAHKHIIPGEEIQTDILALTDTEIKTSRIATILREESEPTTSETWYNLAPSGLQHITGTIELLFNDKERQNWQNETINTFEILASDGGHDPKTGISTLHTGPYQKSPG
jgi:hypothetical protein